MSVIDQFAGPGGWDEGAAAIGITDILGIELDESACATAEAAGHARLCADIAALDPRDFAPRDGLIGSPPCPGFSTAGKGKGREDFDRIAAAAHGGVVTDYADPRSALTLEPLRWALALLPRWIALEQVPPVLPIWELFAEILREHGYSVDTGLLSAEQFGVPQTRKRAFLVASLDKVAMLPTPTHSRYYPRDPARLDNGVLPWVSMAAALGWGTVERPGYTVTGGGTESGGAEPFGSGARAGLARAQDAGTWLRHGAQARATCRPVAAPAATVAFGHDAASAQWVTHLNPRQVSVEPRPVAEPAPTLTAGGLGKGVSIWDRGDGETRDGKAMWPSQRPSTTVNCDPRISRPGRDDPAESGSQQRGAVRVTTEEAAVLMGFPPGYPWQGSRTKQFQQIGNAVCPPVAAAVLAQVAL